MGRYNDVIGEVVVVYFNALSADFLLDSVKNLSG
jgi:hypothetical protein